MGMSMRKEQSDTLERLYDAVTKTQLPQGAPGTYFIEQPIGGSDYGTETHPNMILPVERITEDGEHCITVGRVVIRPDGGFTLTPEFLNRKFGV